MSNLKAVTTSARRIGFAVLLLGLSISGVASADVCRVATDGNNSNDGSNWTTQAMDLQTALTTNTCTEVWARAGTYMPTSGTDRSISFNIQPGIAVYGGFTGTETQRSERNPAANPTILSGDIGTAGDNNDNSYHVVLMDGTTAAGNITATTVLDGFTVSGGRNSNGGGLYCNGSGNGNVCSPTISNVVFSGNSATLGGAMLNDGRHSGASSPTLSNVTFSDNHAPGRGGAMYNYGRYSGTSSPTLSNVTFSGNRAGSGGAMYNDGQVSGTSSPALSNVTFSDNSATSGGAMLNSGRHSGTSSPTLSNVILWGNNATRDSPEIYNYDATPTLDHSVVQGGCPAGSTCTNLITTDPLLGALASNGGSTQTLLPGAGSSAIDAGDDSVCASAPVNSLDQRGITRPQGSQCDIGAAEVAQALLTVAVSTTGGTVDAVSPPIANGAAIAACSNSGGTCSAYYSTEPSAPSVALTLTPATGYHLDSASGCAGNLTGTTYTTGAFSAACTVNVSFAHGAVAIPTIKTWGLLMLMAVLLGIGMRRIARHTD